MSDPGESVVAVDSRGPVLVIAIDRPRQRNAVNRAVSLAIAAALDQLDADDALRAGVITGTGGHFCAGMDLKAFLAGELFRIEGGLLHEGWAEEDYLSRKRQLRSGEIDAIRPPHPAPWDEPVRGPDAATEAVVRDWLADPAAPLAEAGDIGIGGRPLARPLNARSATLSVLVSAGCRAAFHAVVERTYAGGFEDRDRAIGSPAALAVAGLVDVADGRVVRAQVCGDRLGLQRRLANG